MKSTASPFLSCSVVNSFNFGMLSPSSPVSPPNVFARFLTALSSVIPVAVDSCADASMTFPICSSVMPREARYACCPIMTSSPRTDRDCSSEACVKSLCWISDLPFRALSSLDSACCCTSAFFNDTAPRATRGAVSLMERVLPTLVSFFSNPARPFSTSLAFCWNSYESAPIFISRSAILLDMIH